MTYEDLIVAIAGEAPKLSSVALRLLLELVALSIEQGSSRVYVSCRQLTDRLGASRDRIAEATLNLQCLITADVQHGKVANFTLPAAWFDPQRPLFMTNAPRQSLTDWSQNQASTGHETRPVLVTKPGQLVTKPGQYWSQNQASTGHETRPVGHETRPDWSQNQASSPDEHIRNAGTRVDRSIDPDFRNRELILLIDRALRTVEILPAQQQDAEILSETLQEYRNTFDATNGFNSKPDETVLARILAIAPIDELCGVLRKLLYEKVRPGRQDMWFFTVLVQKLHGGSPKLTRSRYDALKARKPPMNETLPNFGHQMVQQVASGMPRF